MEELWILILVAFFTTNSPDKAESVKAKLEETPLSTFNEIFGEGWWDKDEAFNNSYSNQIDESVAKKLGLSYTTIYNWKSELGQPIAMVFRRSTNGIDHRFLAPYNPMLNGQAKRFVDTFKRAFRKIKGEGAPSKAIIETILVSYRMAPCDSLNGHSPAEMFLGRSLHHF
uniref:Helix-turn-helix domain-containing protein n=1 Tax=Globodera rostochiensis TaxID=31243 RepID=A0A914HTV2_GLORO